MSQQKDDYKQLRDAFLYEVYYKPIETIIRTTKRPELRPILEERFYDWLMLENSIRQTKDLEEVSNTVDSRVKSLVQAINIFNEQIVSDAEVEKAIFRKEMHEEKLILLDGLERTADDELIKEVKDINNIIRDTLPVIDGVIVNSDNVIYSLVRVRTQPLKKAILHFKITKVFRRCLRELERFFLAIVVFGVLLGSAVSESAKLLFQNNWKLLIACGAIWAVLKEYKIGPWLRKRRFEKGKKDLSVFLCKVFETEIQLVVITFLKRDKELKSGKTHAISQSPESDVVI